jgi:selenocysteine-specific elongation factor
MSREDMEAAAEVEALIRETRFQTPRSDEIPAKFPKYNRERLSRVLGLLAERGAVVALKDGVLFHQETVQEAIRLVTEAIRKNGSIEAGQFRDLTGTTRKYVIPLLEHLDDLGVTKRVENKRVLRRK